MSVIDTRLRSLLQRLNLSSAVKPANLHEAKEAFLHPRVTGRRKSPVFRYENSPLKSAGFDAVLPFQKKIYAGRCLAVYLSLSAGFAEVFEELRDYFDEQTAYAIVERIKRGLCDTAHAGALTKEFHYFTGPDKIRSYLHRRGNLSMLMGGKIAFKYVQVMAKLVQDGFVDTSKWVFPLEMKADKKSVPVERCLE